MEEIRDMALTPPKCLASALGPTGNTSMAAQLPQVGEGGLFRDLLTRNQAAVGRLVVLLGVELVPSPPRVSGGLRYN